MTNKLFFDLGFNINGIIHLTPIDTFNLCEKGVILIDVREDYLTSYIQFDIKNVQLIPFSVLKTNHKILSKNNTFIFADAVGLRSKEAIIYLSTFGYQQIANMIGGIVDWEKIGLPIRKDFSEQLTGSCVCQLRSGRTKY